ncbi:hypothetical protein KC19_8G136400 [Ceratodon purpureus]|uniref:HMA domain-containing protein n=1 Tax=Ceratodon purpureus TaxID=3225 RepID=A0A8T0H3S5_CERPU|nr:hypothetical protein KC19_8G136400 [Ceratodon purpureus]
MMTMTELFYGPIEPTWIVHPQYPVFKRPNGHINSENPYLIYPDEAFAHRRNPYMQRSALPYTTVAHDGTQVRPGHGAMHPYQAQYFVQGANGANALNFNANHGGSNGNRNQKHGQSPARAGVLQPRNAMIIQTVHFMVPLCCDKCEDTVKEQLLDLEDVQRVSCDQWKQKVTVTSAIAPERLLKRLQKIKKRTIFWPHQQSGAIKVFNGNQVKGNQAHHHHNQKVNDSENLVGSDDENSFLQLEV